MALILKKLRWKLNKQLKGSKIDRTEVKIVVKPKLDDVKKIYRMKEKIKGYCGLQE